MRAPAIFTVAYSLTLALGSTPPLRGVDPSLARFYDASQETFACLDRSRKVSFSSVNDNYCDCLDGSDEPGTSACANGSFFCQNRGYEPLVLNTSMVDDGICDCCDGSDEPKGKCKSTCLEAGAELRKELKAQAAAFATGAAKREVYIRDAGEKKKQWTSQLATARAAAKQQQRSVDRLKAAKERVEAQEATEREAAEKLRKQQEEVEAKKKEQEAATTVEASKQEAESNPSPDATSPGPDEAAAAEQQAKQGPEVPKYEVPDLSGLKATEKKRSEEAAEGGAPAAGSESPGEEQDSDKEAKERLAQWVRDDSPQAADAEDEEVGLAEAPAEPSESAEAEQGGSQPEAASLPARGVWGRTKAWVSRRLGTSTPTSSSGSDSRQAVKDNFFKEDGKLKGLTKEVTDLETRLKQDFGEDGQFVALADRCFEVKADKYVYSMCPYKEASQKDGGSHTRLGTWQGFGEGHASMRFDKGQGCWQGPARSFQVRLQCGATEELSGVQEPNRCEYTAVFATPAACTPALAAAVTQRLQSWNLHDEL